MRLLLLTNVTISLPLIIQSDLDETERVRFDDQGFESCLLNHADDLSSSDPRSRYRVLFRVAYVTPQSRIGHEVLFRHVLPHSRCRFALPSSPSFGLLPSLGGSADDQLMITYLDDVMVAQNYPRRLRGCCSCCLARPNVPRLVSGSGSSHRSSDKASRNRLTTDSTFSSYRPDLLSSYHSSHRSTRYKRKQHTRNTTPAHQHSLRRTLHNNPADISNKWVFRIVAISLRSRLTFPSTDSSRRPLLASHYFLLRTSNHIPVLYCTSHKLRKGKSIFPADMPRSRPDLRLTFTFLLDLRRRTLPVFSTRSYPLYNIF
jgi:hypothetical protein